MKEAFLRALAAFLALPGLVAFAIPALVVWPEITTRAPRTIGLVPFIAGTFLLCWCVRDFYVAGKGTLAPWDPPRNLVIVGLYRVSRNPMYIAVTLVLIGWTFGYRSLTLAIYTLGVMLMFELRVVFGEEPWLEGKHQDEWRRYAARVPRWLVPPGRSSLLVLLVVLISGTAAGSIVESLIQASAATRFMPPGTFVDVGGRRLHLVCIGEGEPTIFFEAPGFGVSSLSAATVRERVSEQTRVCSYDRAGMGWSDAAPETLSAGTLASDLLTLQERGGLNGPIIIVASSVGGLTAEMFARRHPERVAGLVFLDAANSGNLPYAASMYDVGAPLACAVAATARFGMFRLIDPFDLGGGVSETNRRSWAFTYSAKSVQTLCSIVRGLKETVREFNSAPALPANLRMVVLSASRDQLLRVPFAGSLRETRLPMHQALAKRSTRGSWRIVPDSEHLIASSQPDVVIAEILAMLRDIRLRGR
jgi:protein-S-isoprenylcysteine O-methyltransferase Ste14/pimeloyl-ACP methyl ester carboxylesterase